MGARDRWILKPVRHYDTGFYAIVNSARGPRNVPRRSTRGIMGMAIGTVKWFNASKGYGFIIPSDGGSEVFAHFSAIQMEGYKSLKQGQQVEYEVQDGPKGPQASKIRTVAE